MPNFASKVTKLKDCFKEALHNPPVSCGLLAAIGAKAAVEHQLERSGHPVAAKMVHYVPLPIGMM